MSEFVTRVIRAKTELRYVACNLTLTPDADITTKVGLVQRIAKSLREEVSVSRQVHNAIGWGPYDAVFESFESLVEAVGDEVSWAVRRAVGDDADHSALHDFLCEAAP